MRAREIGKSSIGSDSIAAVKRAHPDINFRHLITETDEAHATGVDELDFTLEITGPMIEAGKAQSGKAVTELNAKQTKSNSMESELQEIVQNATYKFYKNLYAADFNLSYKDDYSPAGERLRSSSRNEFLFD